MTLELFLAALRHAMTAGGVYAVSSGWATEESWTTLAGAVITIVGFGWSAWRKYARELDA